MKSYIANVLRAVNTHGVKESKHNPASGLPSKEGDICVFRHSFGPGGLESMTRVAGEC